MEKAVKMLAICILVSSVLISGVLFYNHYTEMKQSRYYFSATNPNRPIVFDNITGQYYFVVNPSGSDQKFYVVDPIHMSAAAN